ncbi:MAG: glmM [Ilumatobacteraceae bacterium]|nr:glmM [Ilumatobacteraceae bacterium]
MLRFGTDGVRGVALTELTTDYVAALGVAAARVLGGGTWLIGRDTRESGPALTDALVRGLRAAGAEVVLCGVLPTPALAAASAALGAPAAMITASHNPFADNGVKVFAAGGLKLGDHVEQTIEAELEAALTETVSTDPAPAASVDPGRDDSAAMLDRYVANVVAMFPADVLAGMRVVLDCANGAMSVAAPAAVRALGADVVVINADPDGRNINDRCGATEPAAVGRAVVAERADVGLAFDGDGDRVIAVDHTGRIVDGDRLIALGALQLRAESTLTANTVVVTVMSNLGFHHAMREAGIDVVTTGVGDRYVLEALDAGDFALGGEQSGHIIYRHLATTGDGLLAGLKVLQRVRGSGTTLAELSSSVMTTYPQVLVNIPLAARHPRIAEELSTEIAAAEAELGDEGRVLVRASGTEPLVRVMVEAATEHAASTIAGGLADVVRARFG